MATFETEEQIMAAVVRRYPPTFGLRTKPGCTFRISAERSFFEHDSPVIVLEQRDIDGEWHASIQGPEAEFRKHMVPL